jgi:hypothetical protein
VIPTLFLSEVLELALYGRMDGAASHLVPIDALLSKVREVSR